MNKFYQPKKSLLRATFAAGATESPRFERVDRENNCLHGVQVTLEGEALGHDIWLDRPFCEDVVKAGNERGDAGVKVRFGHPAMCSDALGTYLGRAKNFRLAEMTRKDGTACCGVLADIYLDANADRTDWVLNMAESAPDTFGQSIVFTYSDTKYVDADGVWHLMSEDGATLDNSADGKEYAVLGVLHGTDFTDTPAATDGVFAADSLAGEAENLLAEHPQVREALEKSPKNVIEFLKRTGLTAVLDALENNRVSGLQRSHAEAEESWKAEMTKLAEERDALATKYEDYVKRSLETLAAAEEEHKAAVDRLNAELAEKATAFADLKALADESAAKIESLTADLTETQTALKSSQEDVDGLKGSLKDAENALAAKSAALETAEERYRAQVGKALAPAASESAASKWTAKYRSMKASRGKTNNNN